MATQTLQSFAPQNTEAKKDPSKTVGAMGWLSETIELVTSGQGRLVNESPVNPEQFKKITTEYQEIRQKGLEAGSLTGFQIPRFKEGDADRLEKIRASLMGANVNPEVRRQNLEEEVRLEMAGLSDEDLAVEGNYQSSYRGLSLRKIYNKMWVFFKRVAAKIAGQKEQTAISIAETRNQGKSALQGMFEGASGQMGGGQANISFQAAG